MKIAGRTLLLLLAFFGTARIQAASSLNITGVTLNGPALEITANDAGSGATGYYLQYTDSLDRFRWFEQGALIPARVGPHLISIPRPNVAHRFYQLIGVAATTEDADGDGLSGQLEQTLGTNPLAFDSDGDGFGDGVEYSYGTSGINPLDFPSFLNLPSVQFEESKSATTEGHGLHVVRVAFDRPYSGTLKYMVHPLSTAAAPVDFAPLSGSASVVNQQVEIVLMPSDDLNISPTRTVVLELSPNSAQPYLRGGRFRHYVTIAENDSWWSCVLRDGFAERNLRFKQMKEGSATHIVFAAGAGLDGLAVLPGENVGARSSQSEGVIPTGSWPGTVHADNALEFLISSPPFPAVSGSLFGNTTALARTLILHSKPAATGSNSFHLISPNRRAGTYEEIVSGNNYFNYTNTGAFVMLRDLPQTPQIFR